LLAIDHLQLRPLELPEIDRRDRDLEEERFDQAGWELRTECPDVLPLVGRLEVDLPTLVLVAKCGDRPVVRLARDRAFVVPGEERRGRGAPAEPAR